MAQGVRGMRSRAVLAAVLAMMLSQSGSAAAGEGLWGVYEQALKGAKYVDLTHTITPKHPGLGRLLAVQVRAGQGRQATSKAMRRRAKSTPMRSTASRRRTIVLATDQLGTQLDPPAHWAPEYPAIDELPATYAIRPLVVIPIVEQVKVQSQLRAPGRRHRGLGEASTAASPKGSVVFVRSDWSKAWPDPKLATLEAVSRRRPRSAEIPASGAQDPVPRPRAARHRLDPDARRRDIG